MPDPDPTPDPTPDPAPDPQPDPAPDPKPDPPEPLGEPGKAALEAERTARKAAEKSAREAQKKLDAIEAAKLSDTEKLQKAADEGKALAEKATAKLRQANLITELAKADHGLADPRAAAKLIEGVEFDDDDEPTNLKDAVKALVADYPLLKGGKPRAPRTNGGEGNDDGVKLELTAAELQQAKDAGMSAEQFAGLKNVKTFDEWQKLRKRLAKQD